MEGAQITVPDGSAPSPERMNMRYATQPDDVGVLAPPTDY